MNILTTASVLSGTVRVPASKSAAHRAYICSALAVTPADILCSSTSVDIEATVACLDTLTAPAASSAEVPRVLDCKESGSTLRFLLPIACALGAPVSFTGADYLAKRPLAPLCDELAAHGMTISKPGTFPLTVSGQLQPGRYTLPGNISSQYISGLLFALPLLPGDSDLYITGTTESASYVKMTLDMQKQFGIRIDLTDYGYHIPGNQSYISPETVVIEADWSSAAFWLCAGAIGTSAPYCSGLDMNSLQGDRAVLRVLEAFGAVFDSSPDGIRMLPSSLHGTVVDAADIPDLVPVLSVVAANAEGKTEFINAGRLRLKESDRIAAIEDMLGRLGVRTESTENTLTVYGGYHLDKITETPIPFESFNDHRIVMSSAVAATTAPVPVLLTGAGAVSKSYPDFFKHYILLGGQILS